MFEAFLLLSSKAIIGVFHEEKNDRDDTEEESKKEPKPCTSIGILSPERTESSEQHRDSTRVCRIAGPALYLILQIRELSLNLPDPVILLLLVWKVLSEGCGRGEQTES
jgi:hypothetical protein